MAELEELIREYDHLYNGFMRCVGDLQALAANPEARRNEDSLLERISHLESEKETSKALISQISSENRRLGEKIEGLHKANREVEEINDLIHSEENTKIEELHQQIARLQGELGAEKAEAQRLKALSDRLFEQSRTGEEKHLALRDSLRKELDQLRSQSRASGEMLEEYRLKVSQVEEELGAKQRELNRIKSKGNQYHKNYNVMSQMFKANEARVRSLEGAARKHEKVLERLQKAKRALAEGAQSLARELKKSGKERKEVQELLGEAAIEVGLDEVFDFELPVDTLMEREFGVNRNIGQIKREFDSKGFEFGEQEIAEFEREINGTSRLSSGIFDGDGGVRSPVPQTPLSTSFEDAMDFSKKKSSEVLDVEPRLDTGRKAEFKKQMQKQIEEKILSRKSTILGRDSLRRLPPRDGAPVASSKRAGVPEEPGQPEQSTDDCPGRLDAARQEIRTRLEPRLKALEAGLFDPGEVAFLENRLGALASVPEFVEWLFGYSVEKLRKSKGALHALESEKSGLTKNWSSTRWKRSRWKSRGC